MENWVELSDGSAELLLSTRIKIVVRKAATGKDWRYEVYYSNALVESSQTVYGNEGAAKQAGILYLKAWLWGMPIEIDMCLRALENRSQKYVEGD